MYYRDTYETLSGYGIFFLKNQVYGYKRNGARVSTNKGSFCERKVLVYWLSILLIVVTDLISFICDIVDGI